MDMVESYKSYRRLLFAALARLARQGLVIPPGEALDIIHSFFLDQWEAIERNYDPSAGARSSYIYSAFVRYARRAILRERRFQERMLDVGDMVMMSESDAEEVVESRYDTELLNRRLQELPEMERQILLACLAGSSMREIAGRHEISRYQTQELVARAIAKVAVAVDRPSALVVSPHAL